MALKVASLLRREIRWRHPAARCTGQRLDDNDVVLAAAAAAADAEA